MITYTDTDYAYSRLSGCIVMYGGSPVSVRSVERDGSELLASVSRKDREISYVRLSDLDLTPPKIGYINKSRTSLYLIRRPARQWKQGFRLNQLNRTRDMPSDVWDNSVINMITNNYPNIQECMESIDCMERIKCAFHRDFCLGSKQSRGFTLFNKGKQVGHVNDNNSTNITYELDDKFSFLRESLDQILGGSNVT